MPVGKQDLRNERTCTALINGAKRLSRSVQRKFFVRRENPSKSHSNKLARHNGVGSTLGNAGLVMRVVFSLGVAQQLFQIALVPLVLVQEVAQTKGQGE